MGAAEVFQGIAPNCDRAGIDWKAAEMPIY